MKKKLTALLLVTMLLVSLLPLTSKKALASSWASLPEGNYYIKSVATGRALDVQSGGDYNTCNVATYGFNGSNAQIWQISGNVNSYRIKPKCTASRVLNQYGDFVASGHNVNLWDDVYDPTQRWVFEKCAPGCYIIRCAGNTNCVLDIAPNGNVYVNNYSSGRQSQMWTVTRAEFNLPAGNYYFMNVANGKYMDVQSGGDYNNCNVGTYGFNGSNAQTWRIDGTPNSFRIKPACTVSRVLNQYGNNVASGHNVNIWDDVYDATQRWSFEYINDLDGEYSEVFIIHCQGNPACVLDLDNYGSVCVKEQSYSITQYWVLVPTN